MTFKKHGLTKQVYQHYPLSKPMNNKYTWEDVPVENRENSHSHMEAIMAHVKDDNFSGWFDTPANIEGIKETGYVHLAMYKMNPKVISDLYAYAFKRFPKEFGQLINNYSKFH